MAVTFPIIRSSVLYYPNGVDALAATGGAIKIPGMVNRAEDESLTCDMRIYPIDDTGAGTLPQRVNVKHKSEATIELEEVGSGDVEAYWDWE